MIRGLQRPSPPQEWQALETDEKQRTEQTLEQSSSTRVEVAGQTKQTGSVGGKLCCRAALETEDVEGTKLTISNVVISPRTRDSLWTGTVQAGIQRSGEWDQQWGRELHHMSQPSPLFSPHWNQCPYKDLRVDVQSSILENSHPQK